MTRKRKSTHLIDRLQDAAKDLICACDCYGRGCTICMAADVILEAIKVLRVAMVDYEP